MATAFKVHLTPSDGGDIPTLPQTTEAAQTATELLQTDLDKHHIFFNDRRFHNHIPHMLLSFLATGASPAAMHREYTNEAAYQRPVGSVDETVLRALHADYDAALPKSIRVKAHYATLIRFYQEQIDKMGWKAAVVQYVFSDAPSAVTLTECLFGGLLHPLIELMYALEFEQPALIGQALAQAVVQGGDFTELFAKVDALDTQPSQSVVEMIETMHTEQPGFVAKATPPDVDDLFGITTKAQDELASYLARIQVNEDVEEALDELMHVHAYVALAAAFKAGRKPKLDFFLVHHHNLAPLLAYLKLNHSWIPRAPLVRLIQYTQRVHIIDYISQCAPRLALPTLQSYTPRDSVLGKPVANTPRDLLARFHAASDDAHIIKVARGLLIAEQAAAKYTARAEQPAWLRIKDKQTWLKMHYVLLDSIENRAPGESAFVAHAGYDEAWTKVPKLDDPKL